MKPRRATLAALLALSIAAPALAQSAPPRASDAPPVPAFPEARVRAWQVGLLRGDRLQHLGFSYTIGTMTGLASESPAAAAGSAFALGLAKELWDLPRSGFDVIDLAADALGAAGAAATTVTLTR